MVSRFRQNLAVSVWRSKNGKTLNEVPCRLKNVCVWGGGGGGGEGGIYGVISICNKQVEKRRKNALSSRNMNTALD